MIWKTTISKLCGKRSNSRETGLKIYFIAFLFITGLFGNIENLQAQTAQCDIIETGCPPDDLYEPCGNVTVNDVLGNYINWSAPDYSLDCGDGNTYQYQISFDLPEGKEECWQFNKVQRVGTGSGTLRLWSSDGNASGIAEVTTPSFYMNETVGASMDIFAETGQNFKVNVFLKDADGNQSGILTSFDVTGNNNLTRYNYQFNPANFINTTGKNVFRIYYEFSAINGTKLSNKNYIEFITIDAGLFGSACAAEANFAVVSTHSPGDFFPVGTTTVTYTATCNGCVPLVQESCSFDVTVNPVPEAPQVNVNPIVECTTSPIQTLDANDGLSDSSNVVWYDASTNGNVVTSPTLNTVGTKTYYAEKVIDGCSSLNRSSVTLTLNQTPSIPVVSSTTNTTCGLNNGTVTFQLVNGLTYSLTDNFNNSYTHNNGVFSNLPAGQYNLVASSANCNSAAQPVTISATDDTIDPTLSISNDIARNSDTGFCSAEIAVPNATFDDNCSGVALTWTMTGAVTANGNNQVGTYTFNVGTTILKYTATDASDNAVSSSLEITVTDNEIPVISAVSPINEVADNGVCGAVLNILAPVATDNCSVGAVTGTRSDNLALTDLFPVGSTDITWTVNDINGNAATSVVQQVTITDNQNPTISCRGDITINTDPGENFAVFNYNDPTFSDNCTGSTLTRTAGLASGARFPKGETTVTYEVEDASGNTATCSFKVNVVDNEFPTINCPDSIVENVDVDLCSAVVTYTIPTGTDNSNNVTITKVSGPDSGSVFPVGQTPVTYRATDPDGNFVECTFNVTVIDNQNPTIETISNINRENDPGVCGAVVTYPTPGASDNCPMVNVVRTAGLPSGSVFPVGTTTVTFEATDGASNSVSTSFDVIVSDTEKPVIAQRQNIEVNTDPDACGATVNFTTPSATDNCGIKSVVLTSGLSSGSEFPVGTSAVTYTATDINDNIFTMTFSVIVTDNEDPVITCPNDINVSTGDGQDFAIVNYSPATASDNCSVSVVKISGPDSGSQFPLGKTTITYEATDASGNKVQCSFDVNVADNEDPTISCPSNIIQPTDPNSCDAVVTFATPTFDDNSGDVILTQTAGPASGEVFPKGTTIVTFKATDGTGNSVSCSFSVTINDDEDPDIASMTNIIVNNDKGICGAIVNFNPPAVSDNCGVESLEVTQGLAPGSQFPVGSTNVTYTVTDTSGNKATSSFTVTVNDNEAPALTCIGDFSVSAIENEDYAIVTFADPGLTDNCGATLSQIAGPTSGSQFSLGTTTVTFQATDAAGNTSECSFIVTVNDSQDPTINCPVDINQNVDADLCTAVVNYSLPTATDNSGNVELTLVSGPAPGDAFPKGTTTVTYRATDDEGNFVECSFDVTVEDDQDPTIEEMDDIIVNNDAGICGAVVSFNVPDADDNCTLNSVERTAGLDSGSVFPVGTTTVTFTATDDSNNTASISFDVIVSDNEDPTITQVETINSPNDTGVCGAVVNYSTPAAIDNCEVESILLTSGLASGSEFPIGTSTVIYTATDKAGNTSEMSFDVVVTDSEDPVISCPAQINVDTDAGESFAVVEYNDATVTDNCSATVTKISGPDSGSQFPLGTTTITFEATDASGNKTQCSFDVVVADDEDPKIACPANIVQPVDEDRCDAVVDFQAPTYSDNSGSVTLTQTAGPASGEAFPLGTTTVTFTATDDAGNSVSCSFTVTIEDDLDPTIAEIADITVNNDKGICGAVVNFDPPAASDNCTLASLSITEGFGPGSEFPVGTTNVTYTAVDAAGNSATSSFLVTVIDNEAPALTCVGDISLSAAENVAYAVVNFADPTMTDNCGATLEQTAGPVSGSQFPLGTTNITFTATDNAGNTTTCSFDVIVNDSEAPSINCPSDIIQSVDADTCEAIVNYPMPTASDNSGNVTLSLVSGPASGDTFPIGTTTVTYRATDDEGNFVECSFDVTVEDDQDPTIDSIEDITVNNDNGVCGAIVNFATPGADDNCTLEGVELTAGLASGSEFPIGTTTVTFTATDESNNSVSTSFDVTVNDNEAPVIACPGDLSISASEGTDFAEVFFDNPTVTDNCDATVTQIDGPTSGSEFPLGTTTVTFEAKDDAGNTTTCSFSITINDSEAPTINCPADVIQPADADSCEAIVNYPMPTASDNSGNVTLSLVSGPASGDAFSIGTTTVTYRATDDEGNFVECSFDVTVEDDQDPTIDNIEDITVNNDNGVCGAIVNFATPGADDNCTLESVELTAGLASGSEFPVGTTTVTFTATDDSNNSVSTSFDVIVIDNEAPVLDCPANMTVEADNGVCEASGVDLGMPTATDNCDTDLTYKNDAPEVFTLGETTVIWTVTDAAGNSITCEQIINVIDTQAPVITACAADIMTVEADNGVCEASGIDLGMPVATDNCDTELTYENDAPEVFTLGETTVTWTITDAAGNSTTCEQIINVIDTQAPVITACAANIMTVEADNGVCEASGIDLGMPTASDNCDTDLTYENDAPEVFALGETTVTWTITDAAGNSTTCEQTINVVDTQAPVISACAQDILNVEADNGVCEASGVDLGLPTVSDNCTALEDLTLTNDAPTVFALGETTVTWTVTDAAGNSTTCEQIVNVIDNQAPVFDPVTEINQNSDAGICGATVTYNVPVATDNCGIESVTLTDGIASGEEFPLGTTTVTYTATDGSGNTSSISFDVTVNDDEAPSIVCPESFTVTVEYGTTSTIVNYEEVTVSDNCGETTVTMTNGIASGEEFPVGETIIEYTAVDENGNESSCSFTITVEEEPAPAPPAAPQTTVIAPTCENPFGSISISSENGVSFTIDGENFQNSPVFENIEPGTYQISVKDEFDQESEAITVVIEEPVAEEIEVSQAPDLYNDGNTTAFDLFNLLVGDVDESGTWIDNDNTGALDNGFIDPSIMEAGTYIFTYELDGFCPSSTEVVVTILEAIVLDCSIGDLKDSISKAVTPNGDNRNDFFEVDLDTECGFTYDLKIFNRWGAEVYTAQNYQNDWDGYSRSSFTNSNQLPSGTYYYILEIRNSEFAPIQGYIYLGTK